MAMSGWSGSEIAAYGRAFGPRPETSRCSSGSGKQLLGQKDSSKVEQTGPAGAAIKHEVQVTLSDAEREQVKAFLGC